MRHPRAGSCRLPTRSPGLWRATGTSSWRSWRSLANLARTLGGAYDDTVIIIMSEFGRTVCENGNDGTDHGHGNVMWVLGGPVRGGKVYGNWPGLAQENLYQGRDLAVTTDFRDVIGTVLARHLRLDAARLAGVFPGFRPDTKPLHIV